jgi:hypothetical protein
MVKVGAKVNGVIYLRTEGVLHISKMESLSIGEHVISFVKPDSGVK